MWQLKQAKIKAIHPVIIPLLVAPALDLVADLAVVMVPVKALELVMVEAMVLVQVMVLVKVMVMVQVKQRSM